MGLRIFTEPQQGASYDQLLAVARTAEECGFDAFFRSDHYLKMGSATGLPEYTDAWTTLAGLARDTERIRLGTLVTPVTFRAVGSFPAIVTQVDHMSRGRVEVGLGAGWYEAEHDAYGLPFPPAGARYDLLEDQLSILHGVSSAEPGTTFDHNGKTCKVSLSADSLRPAQSPHPPIIMGGRGGTRNAGLAAAFADEFNTAFVPKEQMKSTHDAVRKACEAAGRDPESLVWSAALVLCCGASEDEVARRQRPSAGRSTSFARTAWPARRRRSSTSSVPTPRRGLSGSTSRCSTCQTSTISGSWRRKSSRSLPAAET